GHYSYMNGELDDAADLWVINRGDYPESKVRERQAAGDMAWTYGSAPCIYDHLEDNYLSYWTNWGRGTRGFVYWLTFGAWSATDNAWTRNHKGDTNLFYPGHAGATNMIGHSVCPSLRMKVIRDITEVMEGLWLMGNSDSYTVEESESLARRYNTGRLESYVQGEYELKRAIDGLSPPVEPQPEPSKSCDFTQDGALSITDVIAFLLLARDDPTDERLDWNGDGTYTITDAIALLLDIMNGTCPDQTVLLAGAAGKRSAAVERIQDLGADEIEYLEKILTQMNLTQEQKAQFLAAIYGTGAAPGLPRAYSLDQNSPNPFNPSTTITFTIPDGGQARVRLEIFNMRGMVVRTLVDEDRNGGVYHVLWDGTDNEGSAVGSGVYFYRLRAEDFSRTRKMVLLK
ncbi:MAG: T9SS type A sorting domain-containing protein, partial [Gemmatimonadota bacterium]|nr:T9SS type A sorting domain-containing protein [Gemmatimonadota bacterium]